ncbi:hypothetical protein Tco_1401722 [Tanacetum coccineum]
MEKGFLNGRGVKEKEQTVIGKISDMERQLLKGNDNNNDPMSALTAKINDMERQLLDVKLVLTKVNFRTLESGVPSEANFDVKVHIASVEEGRSSYVRAMVEIDACKELINTLVVVVPKLCKNVTLVEKTMGFKPNSKLVYRHVSNRGGSASKKHGNKTFTSNVGEKTNETLISKPTTNKWASSSSNKGSQKFDDINIVSLSDLFASLNEQDKFIVSKVTKEGNIIGNKSLYEQWKETMVDDEYDPYDDDDE